MVLKRLSFEVCRLHLVEVIRRYDPLRPSLKDSGAFLYEVVFFVFEEFKAKQTQAEQRGYIFVCS